MVRRRELDVPVTTRDETLTALSMLRGSIERTHLMLVDLERQYVFQQQKFEEQSSRIQACQYNLLITENELREFEAMLEECLGADWRQQEKALQVQKYIAAKNEILKRHIDDFNAKCQACHDS